VAGDSVAHGPVVLRAFSDADVPMVVQLAGWPKGWDFRSPSPRRAPIAPAACRV